MSAVRLGATIFSFTREYLSREWSLEDCARAVASLGEGQYLEILDSQHISSYPVLTPEAEDGFRSAIDASGVGLSVYGHEVEYGWVAGHPFDDDRIVELVVQSMEIASRLGFPMFRANMPTPALLERLLPHADRLDLDLVIELHSHTIESPDIQELVGAFERWDSPRVGLLQDLGSFTERVPAAFLEYKAKTGVPADLLEILAAGYNGGREKADVLDEIRARGGDALAVETANECFAMFVRTSPRTIRGLGRHLRHVHTKFYEMIDGDEPCIPYPQIMREIRDLGFSGVFSTEWTGFNFIDEPVALDQIRAQQAMVARLWGADA
ncbi:sugar phosphate isomerase/epimerase family protein [Microbacterium sp. RD1]|uniref:sugar phosphate isomerase/epimerase family protein n=1 Tax=Microbacterium sp. RD1 TaxID=3457313 RepID=UPI003FA57C50